MAARNSPLVCDDNLLEFPTKEDLDFFDKFAEIVDGAELCPMVPNVLVMAPTKIAFKNLIHLPKTTSTDKNIGRLFDIFIRRMIQAAGGDLENTCYWLNLRHLDHHGTDGYWIRHKTYKMANGHKLIKLIAKNWQNENTEIPHDGLNQTMLLSMKVFTKEGLDQPPAMKVFDSARDENCCPNGEITNEIRKERYYTSTILSAVGLWSVMQSVQSSRNISASGFILPYGYIENCTLINDYPY